MPYADDDRSVEASLPSELYEFSVNGTVVARLTSREVNVTYDGHTWTRANVRRNLLVQSTQDEPGELLIDMPISESFISTYGLGIPPRGLRCRVIRLQSISGEARVIWQGRVGNFGSRKAEQGQARRCTVRVPSKLFDVNAKQTPGRNFQFQCPHQVYDVNCNVPESEFSFETTISSISTDGKTIVVASVDGQDDDWFKLGWMERVLDEDRRMIVSQVGTTIKLSGRFRTLAVGNTINLIAGCNKAPITCRDKFANIDNYGGHPNVPEVNPWNIYGMQNL